MSTVTVVPTVDLTSTPPSVVLAVTDTGTPNLFATTVTRLDPDGVWRNVRTSDGNPLVLTTSGANRVGTLRDNEAPYGTPVTYSTIESPSTVSSPVTVDETRVWLVDPGTPALSVPIEMRATRSPRRAGTCSRASSGRWAEALQSSRRTAHARPRLVPSQSKSTR
jgi:hypothetical protein